MIKDCYINKEKIQVTKEIEEVLSATSKDIFKELGCLAVIDWKDKPEQQKRMLKQIKRTLYKLKIDVDIVDSVGKNILNLARSLL